MLSRRFCIMIWEEGLDCRVDGKTCDCAQLKSRVEHAADDTAEYGLSALLESGSRRYAHPEYSVGTAIRRELLAEMNTMAMPGGSR